MEVPPLLKLEGWLQQKKFPPSIASLVSSDKMEDSKKDLVKQ